MFTAQTWKIGAGIVLCLGAVGLAVFLVPQAWGLVCLLAVAAWLYTDQQENAYTYHFAATLNLMPAHLEHHARERVTTLAQHVGITPPPLMFMLSRHVNGYAQTRGAPQLMLTTGAVHELGIHNRPALDGLIAHELGHLCLHQRRAWPHTLYWGLVAVVGVLCLLTTTHPWVGALAAMVLLLHNWYGYAKARRREYEADAFSAKHLGPKPIRAWLTRTHIHDDTSLYADHRVQYIELTWPDVAIYSVYAVLVAVGTVMLYNSLYVVPLAIGLYVGLYLTTNNTHLAQTHPTPTQRLKALETHKAP